MVKDWLRNNSDWLMILDNVEMPDERETPMHLLQELLPSPVSGSIITTSRTPALVESSIVSTGVRLQPLNIDEGGQFLLSHLPATYWSDVESLPAASTALAKEISKELGGHPLALRTMSAFITETQSPLQSFLKAFRQNRSSYTSSQSFNEISRVAAFDYEKSLATCWTMSLEPLRHDHRSAGQLLGIITILGPDNIMETILTRYIDSPSGIAIDVLKDPGSYYRAFGYLRRHALIDKSRRYAPPTNQASWSDLRIGTVSEAVPWLSVHRLVQDAWLHVSANSHTLQRDFDHAIICLRHCYPRQINGESMSKDFQQCRDLTSHVLALKVHYERFFTTQKPATDMNLPQERQVFVELLADAGWYLHETGQGETGESLFALGEDLCLQLFEGAPHKLTSLIYNNIGVIYDSRNQPERALEYGKKALAIREKCMAPNDPELGNSLSNIGHGLIDSEKFEEAQVFYRRAVDVHEAAREPSSDLLEGAYSSMGKSMLYLNHLAEAEYWINKAIDQHSSLPPVNPFIAETLFAIGSLRMKQDRWAKAEELIERSLGIRQEILGPDARLVGVCLHHLAFIRHHEGDMDSAIRDLRRSVKIFRVPSQTHPGLLERSLSKLASCLKERGDTASLEESESLLEEIECAKSGVAPDDEAGWNAMVSVAYRCV